MRLSDVFMYLLIYRAIDKNLKESTLLARDIRKDASIRSSRISAFLCNKVVLKRFHDIEILQEFLMSKFDYKLDDL